MKDATDSEPSDGDSSASEMGIGPIGWAARIAGHLVGVATLAVVMALPLVDMATVELYLSALQDPNFAVDGWAVALHVGLAGCAWALLALGFTHIQSRRRDSDERKLIRANRGSVMVETLIVIVPFLLLTSGLAQLALRNVAGILCDLALYQGARTAWVWQPEEGHDRNPDGTTITRPDVEDRARLASAMVLAPSAPSSYQVDNVTPTNELDRMRGTMYATFDGQAGMTAGQASRGQARSTLGSGGAADGQNTTFVSAFDDNSFRARAARKITFAYLALENYNVAVNGGDVEVSFDYQFSVTFPWFAYIFGDGFRAAGAAPGGRSGWYVGIPRPRPDRPASGVYSLGEQVDL